MLEYSINAATRDAIARAHAERGRMMRDIWTWLLRPGKLIAGKAITA
ncbi:MAG: hypothetical protein HRU33_25825 [Rhodobacteraceae bacterium]|nr:hypothetical protein [Paracoccaceae bacterium]